MTSLISLFFFWWLLLYFGTVVASILSWSNFYNMCLYLSTYGPLPLSGESLLLQSSNFIRFCAMAVLFVTNSIHILHCLGTFVKINWTWMHLFSFEWSISFIWSNMCNFMPLSPFIAAMYLAHINENAPCAHTLKNLTL